MDVTIHNGFIIAHIHLKILMVDFDRAYLFLCVALEVRRTTASITDLLYHVLNPTNARLPIFEKDKDYTVFERILSEGGAV